jgi:hypothetical protein
MNETLSKSVVRNYGIRIPALLTFPIVSVMIFDAISVGWKQGMSALALVFIVPCFAAGALLATALLNQYVILLTFRSKLACLLAGMVTVIPVTALAILGLRLTYPEMF